MNDCYPHFIFPVTVTQRFYLKVIVPKSSQSLEGYREIHEEISISQAGMSSFIFHQTEQIDSMPFE
jgi:hypothetical protein